MAFKIGLVGLCTSHPEAWVPVIRDLTKEGLVDVEVVACWDSGETRPADFAKTFAKEDRARIFEKVMGDVAMADQLMLTSAMKAKIKFMCEVIDKAFDTSTWGDEPQYWERYN